MDEFCNSTFWDKTLTWNTTDPFFTHCFEETVLTWIPVGFLISFSLVDVFFSIKNNKAYNRKDGISWNIFNLLKFIGTLALACVVVGQLIKSQSYDENGAVDNLASSLRLLSYLLVLVLMFINKTKGVQSSGVQFYFWLFSTICEAILFRTAVRWYDGDVDNLINFAYFMRFFIFPLVAIQLILNCFADGNNWTLGRGAGKTSFFGNPCPEKSSSHISKLLYTWYDAMAWKGYWHPLKFDDLWDLNPEDEAKAQIPKFQQAWSEAETKAKINSSKTGKPAQVGIMSVLASCYGWTVLVAGIMKLIQDMLSFVSPEILKMLVMHVSPPPNEPPEPAWKGYFYAGILIVTAVVQTLFGVQHNKRMLLVGMRVRTVLSSAVYRKALFVSNASKKDTTAGEIVNLMSVDTQRLMDLSPMFHTAWTSAVLIAVALYFLHNTLGPSIFAGLAVMILMIPINGFVAGKVRSLQMQQMVLKDNRVKLMSELLAGMKVLKLYGWEPSFQGQIADLREKEMVLLKKAAYLNSSVAFSFTCAPFLVALATFATYVLTDDAHTLNANRTFVALSLLNIIRMPMTMLPMSIALLIQASVSINRLNKYLGSEEIDLNSVAHDKSYDATPILVKNATFSWTDESITLKDIDFSVKKGSLTAVVGSVGSGKTSLLSSLLGDLKKHSGDINVTGTIAYASQGAWIQNSSLRDNILFNDAFNEAKYRRVIEACALGPDLEILGAGDQTEIGEKGINLSGGQKQRVALARAAYKESDIYLWDDPLSAVDSHVGKHIFDKLIGPGGMLNGKTRVLVTHGISFLPQVDTIVVMKDGKISEVGTFKELLAKKGNFADFLSQHLGADADEEPDAALIQEIEDVIGNEPSIKRNSSIVVRKRRSTEDSSAGMRKEDVKLVPKPNTKLIEEEKAETGSVKLSIFTDYFVAAGVGLSLFALALLVISSGIVTYSNIWLSDWSEQAQKDERRTGGFQDKDTTNKYLGGYGGLGAAQVVSYFVAFMAVALASMNAAGSLHSQMLTRVMRAPMSYFDTTPLGRLVNRFAKDVDITDIMVPINFRATITIVLSVIATIVVIAYSTPLILVFIVPCLIVYLLLQRFYVATSRQLKRIESVTRSPIYSKFGETISGSTTIRAFELENEFISDSEKKINQNQQAYFPFIASTLWISVRLEFIGGLIVFASAVFAVSARNTISSSIVGLSISSALSVTQLLAMFVRMASELESNIVSVERMKEISTETPQEANWVLDKRPGKEWPQKGGVEFKGYETRYRDGLELVLRGISCYFQPGEKIGIVGRTGAGKSSLTLALFRLVEPSGGSITIDGVDITTIGLHDLRSKITIIPQDPVLFSGNLRINLDPFNAYTDDEIWKCLESAHLKAFVTTLPTGLSHEVQEEGQNFSVGQRQLVCLARALLRKTKILVLDEATAAVDLETDDLIQKTIRSEFADSTVITIAHRLNTILDSTRVVVLDKGVIVEFDSPKNLLENQSSIFYAMAKDAGLT